MTHCADCANWIVARKTAYDDGSVVENYRAPDGNGHCGALDKDFPPDFGCLKFEAGDLHETLAHKPGAPWQHWHMGPCPDCTGKGSNGGDSACRRCAGTSKVRYYDDGYIGEERTRLHPMEKDQPPPVCVNCDKTLDRSWVRCPWCGAVTNRPQATEIIANDLRTV